MPSFGPIGGPQKYGAWGPVPETSRLGPYGASYGQQSFGQQEYGHQPYNQFGQQAVQQAVGGAAEALTTLWVGDLTTEVSDQDLLTAFAVWGQVLGASVSRKQAASGARSGFVRFASRGEASTALNAAVSGAIVVLATPVTCQWARSNTSGGLSGIVAPAQQYSQVGTISRGAPANPSWSYAPVVARGEELATIWVGNLPEGTSDMDLAGVFGQFGQVVGAAVHTRPSPMGSYGGFVRFSTRQQAMQALATCSSGQVFVQNSTLVAQWAKTNSKVDPSITPPRQYNGFSEYGGDAALGTAGVMSQPDGAMGASSQGSVQTLFIGSLPINISQADVTLALAAVGIEGAVTLNKPSARGGSGFLRFATPENAQLSFQHLVEYPLELDGQQVVFKWAKNDTFRAN